MNVVYTRAFSRDLNALAIYIPLARMRASASRRDACGRQRMRVRIADGTTEVAGDAPIFYARVMSR